MIIGIACASVILAILIGLIILGAVSCVKMRKEDDNRVKPFDGGYSLSKGLPTPRLMGPKIST